MEVVLLAAKPMRTRVSLSEPSAHNAALVSEPKDMQDARKTMPVVLSLVIVLSFPMAPVTVGLLLAVQGIDEALLFELADDCVVDYVIDGDFDRRVRRLR